MIVLQHHDQLPRLNLIFGLGMVGDQVQAALADGNKVSQWRLPFTWGDRIQQEADGALIERKVVELCQQSVTGPGRPEARINVLWSAGSGGFEMNDDQLLGELASFNTVLGLAERLSARLSVPVVFHLVSSAGGIFEGQVDVDGTSQPRPRRPYGELKLRQESALAATPAKIGRSVYRLSTVYGFSGFDRRIGLIARLVWDNINHKVTRIFGSLETMRDYVFGADAAGFIAREMLCGRIGANAVHTLASGKPTSINEVIRIIDRIMPHKSYMQIRYSDFNSQHNSFSPRILPSDWIATDLETGIRMIRAKIMAKGSWT